MKTFIKNPLIATLLLGMFILTSCGDDDDASPSESDLTVNLTGLEDLGDGYAYEGWLIVNGDPVSTGVFNVSGTGTLNTTFEVATSDLNAATMFVLSIEPVPDTDPLPAATKILAGAFDGTTATLATSPVGSDFEDATGKYIIAAPTGTGDPSEEFSGIWFLDNSSGSAVAGLVDLPTLGDGWKYEGWVVIDGTPVTTGTFTDPAVADDSAPFSGTNGGPAYPGEDFLNNAPAGLTFPTDLRSRTAVISIEPDPDNSTAPFLLKPLVGTIPATLSGNPYSVENNVLASFPTGSVTR